MRASALRLTTSLIALGLVISSCAPPPGQIMTATLHSDACTIPGFQANHADAADLSLVPAESLDGGRLAWARNTDQDPPPAPVWAGLSGDVLIAVVVDSFGKTPYVDPVKVVISRYQGGVSPYDSSTETPRFTQAALREVHGRVWSAPTRHGTKVNAFHCVTVFYHATGDRHVTAGFIP